MGFKDHLSENGHADWYLEIGDAAAGAVFGRVGAIPIIIPMLIKAPKIIKQFLKFHSFTNSDSLALFK